VVERGKDAVGVVVDRDVEPHVRPDERAVPRKPSGHVSGRTTMDSVRPGPTPMTEIGADVIASIAST